MSPDRAGTISKASTGSNAGILIDGPADTVQALDIDGVATFADAKQKNSDDDESYQNREGDADLDQQRHALGPGRGEKSRSRAT